MKRTQIQLDEKTHAAVRRAAYEQGRSMASVIRETLAEAFGTRAARGRKRWKLTFVGIGRGGVAPGGPVSERHDEAIAADVLERIRR